MLANLFTSKNTKEIARLNAAAELKTEEIASLQARDSFKAGEITRINAEREVKAKELIEKEQLIVALKAQEEALLAVKSAMEGASAAIMMINRDFIVTYVNKASINLFAENAAEFKSAFPSFDPAKLMGTCIDVFYEKPVQQRQMLAVTSNLPLKMDMKVGSLTIALYVTATYCQTGKHTGNVLEWRDVTAEKRKALQDLDAAGQIAAINKIQGVIEFDLTGKITAVNDNFANVTGYSEKEIVGNHHSMFVEPAYRSSHEYKAFWEKLNRGEADEGQYKRIGKSGKAVWLQASYNPIMDLNGKPFKVVKYATDITAQHNDAATLVEAVEETQIIIEGAKAGDLTSRVSLDGKTGAIASLCDGVNALMDKMTEVIVQVREAGETINTAAGEISSGNSDLSSRTEQQASSLEETASSMEELASTVKQNAENAKQANQLAAAASGVAVKGGEVVGQVVNTMSAINQSARKIEDIISVIDGIAFQTNILALNAAVEAARAGEQGRGFAVVAGEVRNLAQRSATAAKEIKELIADSVSKTTEGTAQVETAGKTMQEIVTSVQRVTDIMGEISAASSEQSAGINQVNDAITSMDEVTQQNAALVEQAAAAAESLVDQAVSLIEVVSAFQLNDGSFSSNKSTGRAIASRPAASHSTSRTAARSAAPRLVARPAAVKVSAKTGTNDGDWEEF